MNVGFYQGAASLAGLEQWQQLISHNIASSSIPGYKKKRDEFFLGRSGTNSDGDKHRLSEYPFRRDAAK